MVKQKTYKGEKYIYLLMAYKLAKANNDKIKIGHDNGYKGDFQFERNFKVVEYEGKILLTETKTNNGSADFSRVFDVWNGDRAKPTIKDYMNSDGENCGQRWTH